MYILQSSLQQCSKACLKSLEKYLKFPVVSRFPLSLQNFLSFLASHEFQGPWNIIVYLPKNKNIPTKLQKFFQIKHH